MRVAMLISGGGTTAAAIIAAVETGQLKNVEPVLLIASKKAIPGIGACVRAGLELDDVMVIDPKDFASSEAFGETIIKTCKNKAVDFAGQYGWLTLTPPNVIAHLKGNITNQHPGPLDPGRPDFGGKGMYGKRVHQARLSFVRRVGRDFWSEATAQRVADNFDEGEVLNVQKVPILENDTAETLAARMLPFEHEVQIETLWDFADNKVSPLSRAAPLVLPGEEKILAECKQEAIKKYPKG